MPENKIKTKLTEWDKKQIRAFLDKVDKAKSSKELPALIIEGKCLQTIILMEHPELIFEANR